MPKFYSVAKMLKILLSMLIFMKNTNGYLKWKFYKHTDH